MNHTPGPWTVRQDGPAKIPAIESLSGPVAMLYAGESAAADARLIAAAPDLLAAVHGLLASCGPQHESETVEMYRERTALLQWHIDRASEALIKAIGE